MGGLVRLLLAGSGFADLRFVLVFAGGFGVEAEGPRTGQWQSLVSIRPLAVEPPLGTTEILGQRAAVAHGGGLGCL